MECAGSSSLTSFPMTKIPFQSCKNPQNCLVPRKSTPFFTTAASYCYPAQIGHRRSDMACAAPRLQTQHLSCALLPLLGNKTRLASYVRVLRRPRSNVRLFSSRPQARRGFPFKEDEMASPSDLNFEPPLRIVEYPDPILRARNKRIVTYDENLKKLVAEMFDVMYRTDGIGLSAPQVGINVQLLVFNPAGERGEGEEIVLINPKVHKYSKKTVPFNEGCLSFPGIYGDVERPESVKVDARDITGARFSVNISGLPARVFQHEFDHLQGILFFDRMTDEVLDSIRPELQGLEKKFETRTGSPSPEKIDNRETRKAVSGFGRS